ncbi:MAG TPA: IclR family transcriptional regulator [Magnetospirillaceae bacterium]|jgi:DNA-binding IclR family transcriptional regulator
MTEGTDAPRYVAPAVEKGLDVLELLAGSVAAMTQRQIAERLGRSVPEVYRVLASLERRGYIGRGPDETYRLTMKLHQLAMAYPPIARLTDAAAPVLKQLAIDTMQSFHMSVLDGPEIQAILHADSPAPIGFRVRVGGRSTALRNASGRVLLAFQSEATRDWILSRVTTPPSEGEAWREFVARIPAIQAAGYEYAVEDTLKGIADVSFPVVDADGVALAVLTMPFLTIVGQPVPLQQAAEMAFEVSQKMSAALGGKRPAPKFPLVDPRSLGGS